MPLQPGLFSCGTPPSTIAGGSEDLYSQCEKQCRVPLEYENLSNSSSIYTTWVNVRKTFSSYHRDTDSSVFIVALLVIAGG